MTKTEIAKQIEKNEQDLRAARANRWTGIEAYCLRRQAALSEA